LILLALGFKTVQSQAAHPKGRSGLYIELPNQVCVIIEPKYCSRETKAAKEIIDLALAVYEDANGIRVKGQFA
jgi:hypothetical protein